MSCPNCGSNNTHLATQALLSDTYYCNRCGHAYRRFNRTVLRLALLLLVSSLKSREPAVIVATPCEIAKPAAPHVIVTSRKQGPVDRGDNHD